MEKYFDFGCYGDEMQEFTLQKGEFDLFCDAVLRDNVLIEQYIRDYRKEQYLQFLKNRGVLNVSD